MITLPILIPLATIIFSLFFHGKARVQKISGLAGTILLFIFSVIILGKVQKEGVMVMEAGDWSAPFGIVLVIDLFSAIMLVISGIIGICAASYSYTGIDANRHSYRYFIFFHGILMGVNGSFITGDIFNLYVWIEVLLMASYGMLLLGSERLQLEGGIKYIAMNVIASIIFLAAVGVLYGQTGTLNMAELAFILEEKVTFPFFNVAVILFFIALGIKAALFPFFYWLPASYHTPPVAVTAFFAGLMTKVGVYILMRFHTLFSLYDKELFNIILLVFAGFTMVIGVLTAASQMEMRRILSFHIISQIGYIIMGLGIFTTLSIAGSIYFTAHNIFSKTNAFLVSGLINKRYGTYQLKELGNLYRESPLTAFLFLIPAFALAGVPPISGFFGKYMLIKAGFQAEQYLIAGISLLVSMLTLFSMVKIWNAVFLKDKTDNREDEKSGVKFGFFMLFPVIFLAFMSVIMGIGAGYFVDLCIDAAEQLMDNSLYINSVLN
jgi:multicomponent Na+:H+ antiporter subunit D